MSIEQELESLREKAEKLLERESGRNEISDQMDVKELVHELRVHQIELEIQNDELRRVQHIVEDSRKRYYDLFDNAPFGYIILDENGILKQFNKAFFEMVYREALHNYSCAFADLIHTEDAAVFRARLKAILKNPENKQVNVRLKSGETGYRRVLLKAAVQQTQAKDAKGKSTKELVFAVMESPDPPFLDKETNRPSTQAGAPVAAVCRHCKRALVDGTRPSLSS